MSLFEDLAAYTDNWNLVHNVPQDKLDDSRTVSQNGLTFTAEAALLLAENQFSTLGFGTLAMATCIQADEALVYRHPKFHREGNQLSIDCLAGLACIAKIGGGWGFAETVLDMWALRRWRYFGGFFRPNLFNPDEAQYRTRFSLRPWFGKYPAAIAALEWAAGRTPPLWRRIYFGLAMHYGSIETPDGARIARLQAACHPDPYWFAFVNRRIRAHYGSVRMMYGQYFGITSTHPFILWGKG